MSKLHFSLGLFLALLSNLAQAQTGTSDAMELDLQRSFAPFSSKIKMYGTIYGGTLQYHINTTANPNSWKRDMHLKSIDLLFDYKSMHDLSLSGTSAKGTFGDTYALLGGLSIRLFQAGRTELLFSPAFGLTYAGQTYFTNENPIIGSHLNFMSKSDLKFVVPVAKHTELNTGVSIVHYSNAGFRVPNNGMNSANLQIGIVHSFHEPATASTDTATDYPSKTHSFDLGVSMGRRGVYRSKDGYFRTALYAGYNYRINSILALSPGIDAVYYHSVFDPADFNRTYQSFATSYEHWRVGAAFGPDIWMGRLALMTKYGYYLHYNSYRKINTYWTAGMKYSVLPWAAIQAKIYIHKTEADFVGFGLLLTK